MHLGSISVYCFPISSFCLYWLFHGAMLTCVVALLSDSGFCSSWVASFLTGNDEHKSFCFVRITFSLKFTLPSQHVYQTECSLSPKGGKKHLSMQWCNECYLQGRSTNTLLSRNRGDDFQDTELPRCSMHYWCFKTAKYRDYLLQVDHTYSLGFTSDTL